MKYLLLLFLCIALMTCGGRPAPPTTACSTFENNVMVTATKNVATQIGYQDGAGVLFRFTEAQYLDSGSQLTESIKYDLGIKDSGSFDRIDLESAVTFDVETSGGGRDLTLISGGQEITADGLQFSWSFSTPELIHLYIPYQACE